MPSKNEAEKPNNIEDEYVPPDCQLQQVIDALPFYVVLIDEDHIIHGANRLFLDEFEKDQKQILNQYCPMLVHGFDHAYPGCPLEKAVSLGNQVVETEFFDSASQRWLWSCVYPTELFTDKGLTIFLHTLQDITEQKKLEEHLNQSQKMEAIGQLTSGIAHDFNNLLTSIIGYANIARSRVDLSDPVFDCMKHISTSAEKAAELINKLLAFSRRAVVQPKIIDLNNVIHNLYHVLRRTVSEDITIEFEPGDVLGHVRADPVQIDQVIMNLVVNSRDAMPEGGIVTIATENISIDEVYAKEHPYAVPGDCVRILISDTGRGIDDETLTHIFEPFFTTKKKGEGTGLGLSTVYGIIKQNNGYIDVRSSVGKGTNIEVYMPMVDSLETVDMPGDESRQLYEESEIRGGSETVLVVEDDVAVCAIIEEILSGNGYSVLIANSCEEAGNIFRENSQDIELLLTDIVIPDRSGFDLADELVGENPDLKVLFISGYFAELDSTKRIMEAGDRLIAKPFKPRDLSKKIREALDN